MSDAEPKSTSTLSRDTENADGQPSPVAVSEENLAALLRATLSPTEPASKPPAEVTPASSHAEPPATSANPRANIVESRLALFAAVKENHSAKSRSGSAPATPSIEQSSAGDENTATTPNTDQLEIAPLLTAPAASIASTAISHGQSPTTSRTRLVIGLVIGAVIATVGASIFLTRGHPSKTPSVVPPAPKDNVPVPVAVDSPLQVRVELLGNGLIDVRWNPQSTLVAQARDGRMVITEPNQHPRTLALGLEQLKTGHLTYQSVAESVEFNLEVVDRSGAVSKESILALQAPARPAQPVAAPPATQRTDPATPIAQSPGNPGVPAEASQSSQAKIRTFIPPAAQHKTEQRAIIDEPPALTNGPAIPLPVGLAVQPAVILPPARKDAPAPQQIRVESNIEAANLIKRVIPVYPQLARSASIQGIVRFTALIGKDGRILNLKFMSGPPVLVDSASTAVKQWVYRPTLLNGKPVEVITQIDVNFTLHENAR